MTENCFTSLASHARNLDSGLQELSEMWRNPLKIMGGYGANPKQADEDLQLIKAKIEKLKNTILDDTALRAEHIAEMGEFLQESQEMYNNLDQSCKDIKTILSEFGYNNPEDSDREDSVIKSETEYNADSSLIASDVTDDRIQVEFTPDMGWRQKPRITLS
ncbi:uncharacterized protein LOC105687888 [Athalia rosae]|uniref:uncharacterized protein LOC105687888 n=1 Tax=Athalia rosae TaxID=37344 RepID=UPI002033F4B6|nr:uncharacterized protein LOC105687888 [Athalia rosae]